MAGDLPRFAELPNGRAWGLWGDDDQLGTLNLLTPDRVAAAAKLVRKGVSFGLNWRIDRPNPPMFNRGAPSVHMLVGPRGRDDYIDNFYPQASSQWDSLRHILHPEDGFYNGVTADEVIEGGGKLGIENFATRGIAGRGVLLDVARFITKRGGGLDYTSDEFIDAVTLDETAAKQGVALEVGDILLIRTGWMGWYIDEATDEQKQWLASDGRRAPGLGPPDAMAEYLWDLHIAAIAADNPALEAWPPTAGFMHFHLIPHFGMPIGELWYLEDLADDCAADGIYEFFFTSAPLNVPGGVGSPPNALAIK